MKFFLRKLCQTRTTINDPMRVKKGERIKNKIWYIWQIEAFCLEEVFAESRSGSQLDVFHSVLEVKLASKLSGLTPQC